MYHNLLRFLLITLFLLGITSNASAFSFDPDAVGGDDAYKVDHFNGNIVGDYGVFQSFNGDATVDVGDDFFHYKDTLDNRDLTIGINTAQDKDNNPLRGYNLNYAGSYQDRFFVDASNLKGKVANKYGQDNWDSIYTGGHLTFWYEFNDGFGNFSDPQKWLNGTLSVEAQAT